MPGSWRYVGIGAIMGAVTAVIGVGLLVNGVRPAQAQTGHLYRVSVYDGHVTPIRTWVVSEPPMCKYNAVYFESMGKKVTVCGNWVVEEQ